MSLVHFESTTLGSIAVSCTKCAHTDWGKLALQYSSTLHARMRTACSQKQLASQLEVDNAQELSQFCWCKVRLTA